MTPPRIRYPPTDPGPVAEDFGDQQIIDPYRWLEDTESAAVKDWIASQNAYTSELLDGVPGRDAIRARLSELLAIGTIGAPQVRKNRYFYTRRSGDQNQPVLLVRDETEGTERVLLDPNTEGDSGLTVLDWWYPSHDGNLVAFGYSYAGDEWSTLRIVDVASGAVLDDSIRRARYASVAWLPDNTGFYYTRYPLGNEAPEGEENYHVRVFFHSLGEDSGRDVLVFGADLPAEAHPYVQAAPGGRWLVVGVMYGWERSDLYLRDLWAPDAEFLPMVTGVDALFDTSVESDVVFVRTNLDAPRYRLFRVDPEHPGLDDWQEIIPQSPDAVLESVSPAGERLIAAYMKNAISALSIFEPDGSKLADVPLSTPGTVTAVTGNWDSLDAFFAFESFTVPPTIFRIVLASGDTAEWGGVGAAIADDYLVQQEWFESADGTRVSIFIVHRKDLDRSRSQPLLMTGYGGFNLARMPLFMRNIYLWLERGGIFALPNLRGGSEYGEEWHRAGMLDRKQNVFDDFLGAAEHLIREGYTDSSLFGIFGRSNGGLLMGAALTQRPDLFRAVVASVPLMDMLRYHHFLIARYWITEYGAAEDAEQFPFLYAYSPYHHVEDGVCYPAALFTTAEHDTRVHPSHALKMAARLQAAQGCDRPILLRVEQEAGHGIGKPLAKIVEDETDFWSFLFSHLGL